MNLPRSLLTEPEPTKLEARTIAESPQFLDILALLVAVRRSTMVSGEVGHEGC